MFEKLFETFVVSLGEMMRASEARIIDRIERMEMNVLEARAEVISLHERLDDAEEAVKQKI